MEKRDLLEVCDEISEARANEAKSLSLVREMVDLFTQERVSIIQDNASAGLAAVADAYAAALDSEAPDGFGDILVATGPLAERRYHIRPTYHGHIWLSEPDVLGRTVMDVQIPGRDMPDRREISLLSTPIPMDEAAGFIHGLLSFLVPPCYAPAWSKSARANMAGEPSTERQRAFVDAKYDEYPIPRTDLSKLQASDLINLQAVIEDGQLESRQMEDRLAEVNVERTGKALEKWLLEQEDRRQALEDETERRLQDFPQAYAALSEAILRRRDEYEAMVEKTRSMVGREGLVDVPMDYSHLTSIRTPSPKQVAFRDRLTAQCQKKGIRFDTTTAQPLDMWHTGFLINYLLYLSNNVKVPQGFVFNFFLSEFIQEITKHPNPFLPVIPCRFRVEAA